MTAFVDVKVPVRTAYDQWTRFESFPEFLSGVTAVERIDDRNTHWVTDVAGARREFDAEIVEQRPDQCVAWRSTGGEVRHSGTVTFEALSPGSTRVHVDLTWTPEGLAERVGSALGVDQMQVKEDLYRFKKFIENPVASSDATDDATAAPDTRRPPQDIVDVLLVQHARAKELLSRTRAAGRDQRGRCFAELATFLRLHEKAEQQVVHPVIRADGGRGALTAEGRVHEERDASLLVAAISAAGVDAPDFMPRLEELRQAVEAHAAREEAEEFPMLRRHVAPERLQTMAEDFLASQLVNR